MFSFSEEDENKKVKNIANERNGHEVDENDIKQISYKVATPRYNILKY